MKVGTYVEGRHGHPCRIVWRADFRLQDIVRAAHGETEAEILESVDHVEDAAEHYTPNAERQDSASAGQIQHSFRLRPDVKVQFTLPSDLSAVEAGRLAKFIETLPFGG